MILSQPDLRKFNALIFFEKLCIRYGTLYSGYKGMYLVFSFDLTIFFSCLIQMFFNCMNLVVKIL